MTRLFVGAYPRQIIAKVGIADYRANFGMLCSPRDRKPPTEAAMLGVAWAADNFAFTAFDPNGFVRMLEAYKHIPGCQWVVAPDVPRDAVATLSQFYAWQPVIAGLGYRVALAAQDGLERLSIPWNDFACLFVGGSDQWKLGATAAAITREALRRGKQVHMGRVNSVLRLRYAQTIGCTSCDGSSYASHLHKTLLHRPVLQTRQYALGGFLC